MKKDWFYWAMRIGLYSGYRKTRRDMMFMRLLDLNMFNRKTWQERGKTETPKHVGVKLRQMFLDYEKTDAWKLHRVDLTVTQTHRRVVSLRLKSPDGVEISFTMYYWDIGLFLRICDGFIGVDNDELNWMLKKINRESALSSHQQIYHAIKGRSKPSPRDYTPKPGMSVDEMLAEINQRH